MADKLTGVRAKIERAKQHLQNLESAISEYRASGPYIAIPYCDVEAMRTDYRLEILHEPPAAIACIVGDTIHNLRSALDILACALVADNSNRTIRGKGFPISDNPKSPVDAFGGQVKGASMAAMRLIERLKPHKGGPGPFWLPNEMDIIDKHRLLLTVALGVYRDFSISLEFLAGLGFSPEAVQGRRIGMSPAERWAVDGAIIFSHPSNVDMKPEFTIDVALNEPGVVPGQPIVECLQQTIDFVERVVDVFDRHIFRTP